MAAGYTSAVTTATLLDKPEYAHIKAVGFDTDPKVIEAIKAGRFVGSISQNPWGQGYISVYTLKMLIDGWTYKAGQPEVINSGSFLITKDNVDTYDQMIKDETMKLMATWTDRFDPPVK
jgi:ribose transport system substrate-binding protein